MPKQRKSPTPLTEEQYQNPTPSKTFGKVPQYYINFCLEGDSYFYDTKDLTGETVFPYGSVIKAEKLEEDANYYQHMKQLEELENQYWDTVCELEGA